MHYDDVGANIWRCLNCLLISGLSLEIRFVGIVGGAINWTNPATYVSLPQANTICGGLLCGKWFEMRSDCLEVIV